MFQMRRDAIEAVCPERAVLAAFVPVRPVHEVIDQQLAAALEQLRKGLAAVRPIEDVLFLHLHPRQCAALLAQSVALPGKLLLFGQKPRTGIEPLILRNDGMIPHGNLTRQRCNSPSPGKTDSTTFGHRVREEALPATKRSTCDIVHGAHRLTELTNT